MGPAEEYKAPHPHLGPVDDQMLYCLVPVQPGSNKVAYRYKFEYESTTFGGFENDSSLSPKYELKVLETK